jgi:MFS family permease
VSRRLLFALLAMTTAQAAVYVARPMTSYRLLGLGEGARAVGLVTAAFALLPLFLAIPLGRFADRRGGPLLGAGCAVQAFACVLLAFAKTPLTLAAASAVLGLGHLALALGVQEVIARESHDDRHDAHFGFLTAGVSLGQLVGPLIGGFILAHAAGSRVEATTRGMSAAAAIAALATACAIVAERSRDATASRASAGRRGSVRAIVGTRGVPAGIFASIAVLAAADIFTAYMPVLGEQRGIGPGAVGVLLALRAAASMASRLGIGTLVRLIGRARLITFSAASAAAALAAMTATDDVRALAALCVLAGIGLGFGQPLSMTLVVQLVPEHARATALGVRLTGNRLGQVAAPAVAGVVAGSAGAGSVFWLTSAMLFASAVAIQRPHAPPPHAAVEAAESAVE